MIREHTLPRPDGLIEVDVVLDIGAGIRPMGWYKPKRHICVEPYGPYHQILRDAGYEAQWMTAREALNVFTPRSVDAVYLLDVIEHMTKQEASDVIIAATLVARTQVVVYTPFGFVEQTTDAWGLGGDFWQTYRSGWTPDDFPGWRIQPFHNKDGQQEGFFASWEPTSIRS